MQQGDGMHPTRAGVARIVERILPAVEAMLKNVERRD
jgi:lysophospholipase L1-like esterase